MTFRGTGRAGLLRFGLYGLAVLAAVLAYNSWMICCGRCTASNLLTVPWLGWGLLTANLIAGLTLWRLHRRSRQHAGDQACPNCRVDLRPEWTYCPNCGGRRRGTDPTAT